MLHTPQALLNNSPLLRNFEFSEKANQNLIEVGGAAIRVDDGNQLFFKLVEFDTHACATLRLNRPDWTVHEGDLNKFDGSPYEGVEIISGVECRVSDSWCRVRLMMRVNSESAFCGLQLAGRTR